MNAMNYAAAIKCYENVIGRYKNNTLSSEDETLEKLIDVLCPFVQNHECFEFELYMNSVQWLIDDEFLFNEDIDKKAINKIVEYIFNIFEMNKAEHYLVFPLQGSKLSRDVSFDSFNLLTKQSDRVTFDNIARITDIEVERVAEFINHTRNSRSPSFIDSNIMIIKVNNQTSNTLISAYTYARFAVGIAKMISCIYSHGEKHTPFFQQDIRKIIMLLFYQKKTGDAVIVMDQYLVSSVI